ncbi:zinc finger protein 770 isoform X3 [Prionailurus viverrinus]|uniref:zinc finger protein 770 isoform X3 n=1 Tax=Prionailurus viverrinus TaxID=61388 RepID=UPI001FF12054|nr:zinc finger protein 770 isoform X3 [Prionailurus viverrinus]
MHKQDQEELSLAQTSRIHPTDRLWHLKGTMNMKEEEMRESTGTWRVSFYTATRMDWNRKDCQSLITSNPPTWMRACVPQEKLMPLVMGLNMLLAQDFEKLKDKIWQELKELWARCCPRPGGAPGLLPVPESQRDHACLRTLHQLDQLLATPFPLMDLHITSSFLLFRFQLDVISLMQFWSGGGALEPMAKKEFLRHLWSKKVILLKHGDKTMGRKSCTGVVRSD